MALITTVGLGPVGLATTVFFAQNGHQVIGLDADTDRVSVIAQGRAPFFEEGLSEALQRELKTRRIQIRSSSETAFDRTDFVFVCVGTPSRQDGSMDDSFVRSATEEIANALPREGTPIIVVKSTVVPGTTETLIRHILEAARKPFGLAVNPEFLREGHALEDTLNPDRVVLGVDSAKTAESLRVLYGRLQCPIIETDLRTAEAIKYATNAFLAAKVVIADELANICQTLGVSYDQVIDGVALDPRINPRFLVPGVGFGGSCLPKDLRALIAASSREGYDPTLLRAVLAQNQTQHNQALALLEEELGDLKGKRIAILGLSFKGGTDDVRESRAISLSIALADEGAAVIGYDPVANANFSSVLPGTETANTVEEALADSDGCVVQADWEEFSALSAMDFLATMRTPIVIDGRRIIDPARMDGVRFRRIG